MRLETRIGVVLGFVIVVAAGVYFWRVGREDRELIVSLTPPRTDSRTDPVKPLPGGPARGPAQRPRATAATPPARDLVASNGFRSRAAPARQPVIPPPPRTGSPPGSSPDRSASPAGSAGIGSPAAGFATVRPAAARQPLPGAPAGDSPSLVALRTNPSERLRDAAEPPEDEGADSTRPGERRISVSAVENEPAAGDGDPTVVYDSPERRDPRTVQRVPAAPLGAPAVGAADEAGAVGWPGVHVVQPGDTLAAISRQYYGDTTAVSRIMKANPRLNPRRLRVGAKINLPAPAGEAAHSAAAPLAPSAVPSESPTAASGSGGYQVRAGDSFYSIAESELGDASRWKELLALNKALVRGDPARLRPGMRLVLPPDRAAATAPQ